MYGIVKASLKNSHGQQKVLSELEATVPGLGGHNEQVLNAAVLRRTADDSLSEREVLRRFEQLESSITNWVVTYFKNIPSASSPSPELRETLGQLMPSYETLLQQRRTQYLVLRAIVADALTAPFVRGEFLGRPYVWLSSALKEKGLLLISQQHPLKQKLILKLTL
jgi:hypothetical protein